MPSRKQEQGKLLDHTATRLHHESGVCNFWGAVIGAAISYLGARQANKKNIDLANRTNDTNIELANTAIQRRVADSQAAGVHPLYGIGANVQTPGLATPQLTNELSGVGDMLQQHGDEIEAEFFPDSYHGLMQDIEMDTADSVRERARKEATIADQQTTMNTELIEQMRLDTKLKREQLNAMTNKERAKDLDAQLDAVEYLPDQVVSSRSGEDWIAAGEKPMWTEYRAGKDFKVILPYSQEGPSESLEIPLAAQIVTVGFNVERYGPDWITKASKYFPMWDWETLRKTFGAEKVTPSKPLDFELMTP